MKSKNVVIIAIKAIVCLFIGYILTGLTCSPTTVTSEHGIVSYTRVIDKYRIAFFVVYFVIFFLLTIKVITRKLQSTVYGILGGIVFSCVLSGLMLWFALTTASLYSQNENGVASGLLYFIPLIIVYAVIIYILAEKLNKRTSNKTEDDTKEVN